MSRRTPSAVLLLAASFAALCAVLAPPASARPPKGFRLLISQRFQTPHFTGFDGTMHCPRTKVPVGGGTFVFSSDQHIDLGMSFPLGRRWDINISNDSLTDTTFDVRVTCVPTPPGYTVVQSPPTP